MLVNCIERTQPPSSNITPFVAIIDAILEADKQVHVKAIKLPTFVCEYEKVGDDYAGDVEPEQIPGSGVGRL